jgi:hypothetical protein
VTASVSTKHYLYTVARYGRSCKPKMSVKVSISLRTNVDVCPSGSLTKFSSFFLGSSGILARGQVWGIPSVLRFQYLKALPRHIRTSTILVAVQTTFLAFKWASKQVENPEVTANPSRDKPSWMEGRPNDSDSLSPNK